MPSFSERYGHKEPRVNIQVESIDPPLRMRLWNAIYDEFTTCNHIPGNDPHYETDLRRCKIGLRLLWTDHFYYAADKMPYSPSEILPTIKDKLVDMLWNEVYDLLEAILGSPYTRPVFARVCNGAMEKEMAGYRIVEKQVVPITDSAEIATIETAISGSNPFGGARLHLQTALDLLSNRDNPDYRNSIKESISAVESACQSLTSRPNATLGDALADLVRTQGLHGALKKGFSSIYGYTSDEDGIRHAMMEEPNLSQEDALYMLVSCSAFVNYLASKAARSSTSVG